jgi:formylglycine-generating enzyme required for sulfatase activity
VLSALSPEQRRGAREVLLSLVIARGTRARRSREDLVGATAPGDGAAPTSAAAREAALEALIRGRLVVAGDTYEIAHEALVRAWPRLRAWLDEVSQEQATSRRMIEAAAEWERLGGGAEGLWSKRQLAELEVLAEASLPKGARHFVAESRAAVRRAGLRQWAIRSLVVSGALVGVALVVVAIKAGERRQARAFVAARLADADIKIDEAAALELQGDAARAEAFGRYDGSDTPGGEELWSQAVLLATRESEAFVAASTELGLALARDPLDPSARSRIADLTYRWVLAAERDHDAKLASNLTARLAQVDDDGSRRARLAAPAHLTVTTDPPGATIALVAIRLDSDGRRVEEAERAIAPGAALELAPGSYVLKASASGRYSTRYPVLLARGQDERVTIPLPSAADVPAGFVFVPAGDSLLGAADGEWVRSGINAQPQHPVHLAGFFIAELEATYRDYLEYLESLPPSERARRQPSNMAFTDPYCRAARSVRRCQDWKRFPVSGIRWEDAQAYVTWLAAGRVPGARLCTEPEWERAARGSDGRVYAGGDVLHPGDANFAETYHTVPAQMGADEVGSFPADVSPFRVRDLTGNVAEWVVTQQGEPAARGGYWDSGPISCRASCRFVDYIGRVEVVGIRACASSPIHFAPAQIRSP